MTGLNFPHFPRTLKAWLLAALLAVVTNVQAQSSELLPDDPPSQVARLSLTEGRVSMAVAFGQDSRHTTTSPLTPIWQAAELNQPLTSGDQIWSDKGARAELHVGSTTLRLSALTHLDLLQLNGRVAELRLNQGSLRFRVRNLYDGQRLHIRTPNLTFTVTQPGDYRLDVNRSVDATRVVVHAGGGLIQGERTKTEPLTISAQQQGSFSGTQLTAAAPGSAVQDNFDSWAMDRGRTGRPMPAARPLQFQPMPVPPTVILQIDPLAGGSVASSDNSAFSPPSHVNRGNDRVLGGTDGRAFGQFQQRTPDALLEADIQALRDQFRLQQQQRRQQEALAWQQDVQRQRDQAPVGERAMRQQQEGRIDRQMQDVQRYDFQHAQQQPLQLQRIQPHPFHQPPTQPQAQPQLLPPQAVGQQALQEQAQRQQQSDERVRAQQAAGFSRDPAAQRGMPGMVRGP